MEADICEAMHNTGSQINDWIVDRLDGPRSLESEMVASCIFTTSPMCIETWRTCRGDINALLIPLRRARGPGGNYIHNVLKTVETAVYRCLSLGLHRLLSI